MNARASKVVLKPRGTAWGQTLLSVAGTRRWQGLFSAGTSLVWDERPETALAALIRREQHLETICSGNPARDTFAPWAPGCSVPAAWLLESWWHYRAVFSSKCGQICLFRFSFLASRWNRWFPSSLSPWEPASSNDVLRAELAPSGAATEPPACSQSRQVRKYRRASGQQVSCPQMGICGPALCPLLCWPQAPRGRAAQGWMEFPGLCCLSTCFNFACQGRVCLPCDIDLQPWLHMMVTGESLKSDHCLDPTHSLPPYRFLFNRDVYEAPQVIQMCRQGWEPQIWDDPPYIWRYFWVWVEAN